MKVANESRNGVRNRINRLILQITQTIQNMHKLFGLKYVNVHLKFIFAYLTD